MALIERERRDLLEVLERLDASRVAAGEAAGEREEALDERVAGGVITAAAIGEEQLLLLLTLVEHGITPTDGLAMTRTAEARPAGPQRLRLRCGSLSAASDARATSGYTRMSAESAVAGLILVATEAHTRWVVPRPIAATRS